MTAVMAGLLMPRVVMEARVLPPVRGVMMTGGVEMTTLVVVPETLPQLGRYAPGMHHPAEITERE